jgi:hypothetical protein
MLCESCWEFGTPTGRNKVDLRQCDGTAQIAWFCNKSRGIND